MRAIMSAISEDLLAWREQSGVDRFDELWEGVLHMNAAPHGDHQALQDDLREWLKHWWARPRNGRASCQRNVAKAGQWPHNYRIPDIVLMPPDRQHLDQGLFIAGPPLVVVEIRSPDDESLEKLPFYATLQVPEVWIIDRDAKSAQILVLEGEGYQAADVDREGWLTSPATEVMVRMTVVGRLAIRTTSSEASYRELPEE